MVAVGLRGVVKAVDAAPSQLEDWLGRLHALAAVHADSTGCVHPTGTDQVVMSFADVGAALDATLRLVDEVEASREGHRHGLLLAVGVAYGDVRWQLGQPLLGGPLLRAVRLAWMAEERGEVLLDDPAAAAPMPDGIGLHRARADRCERLGIVHHHLADYRNAG